MEIDEKIIEDLYNTILKANSEIYSFDIDELLDKLYNYTRIEYIVTCPIVSPIGLDKNSLMMGVDNYVYIVKIANNGLKYWSKINKL